MHLCWRRQASSSRVWSSWGSTRGQLSTDRHTLFSEVRPVLHPAEYMR